MKYTTYYEDRQVMHHSGYAKMKDYLLTENAQTDKREKQEIYVRKIRYETDAAAMARLGIAEGQPVFSICMQDRDEDSIYLEKKTKQNYIYYKTYANLTREECRRIVNGDIAWMKDSERALLAEFYLQYEVNELRKNYITDFKKEVYPYKNKGYVVFTTEIKRVMKWNADFFNYKQSRMDCLNCDKILVQYKQKATIPQVVANVMHLGSEQLREPLAVM